MNAWELFHHLWTVSVGQPDYDKEKWLALERYLLLHAKPWSVVVWPANGR